MKKCFYFLFLIFSAYSNYGQKIGIGGGANLSSAAPPFAHRLNLNTSGFIASKSRIGYYGSVYGEFRLGKYTSLLVELQGSQSRTYIFIDDPVMDGNSNPPTWVSLHKEENDVKVTLVQMGGKVMYGLPLGKAKASLGGGFVVAYPISANTRVKETSFSSVEMSKKELEIASLCYGPSGILQFEFEFGGSIHLCYEYLKKGHPNLEYGQNRNSIDLNVFKVGIGYAFRLRR